MPRANIPTVNKEDRALGLDRPIARRDFLQGMALAVGAPRLALGSRQVEAAASTPGRLQGQDPPAMALGHRVRNGEFRSPPRDVVETGEAYDLVVVGAGISGLTATYLFNEDAPGEPSILVVENADDFGGHARRNVLEGEGVRLVAAGGTFALEEPEHSPQEALDVFRRIGLDPDRLVGYRDAGFRKRYGLSQAVIFDSRVYGGTTRWLTRWYEMPYEQLLRAGAPARPRAERAGRALQHAEELPARRHRPPCRPSGDKLGAFRARAHGPRRPRGALRQPVRDRPRRSGCRRSVGLGGIPGRPRVLRDGRGRFPRRRRDPALQPTSRSTASRTATTR